MDAGRWFSDAHTRNHRRFCAAAPPDDARLELRLLLRAHGKRSSNFSDAACAIGSVGIGTARHAGKAVDIGSDQRFLWDAWRTKMCGPLEVKKLPLALYPTCRDWLGPSRSNALAVHVTYCHKLSMLLSSEDVCKRRLTRDVLPPRRHRGGESDEQGVE